MTRSVLACKVFEEMHMRTVLACKVFEEMHMRITPLHRQIGGLPFCQIISFFISQLLLHSV
jgi:hypothetical protein